MLKLFKNIRWLKWFLLALTGISLGWCAHQLLTWPDVPSLAKENPAATSYMKRSRKAALKRGESGVQQWRWIAYRSIPNHLKQAVLIAEDINFFSHHGFSEGDIKKAIDDAWTSGKPLRGASTISQQLAKNLWLSPSRNPWRKVKETMLTRQLEHHLDKARILEIYLNVVELGPQVYGVEAAAQAYFGKSARQLAPHESAALATSLPRPTTWHPGVSDPRYQRRIQQLEGRMAKARWLLDVLEHT